ncbi:MAG: putative sulfate exporter family transporter, partial [Cyclobacteriaceae bacterium]|nr:putative sulfate exporter family transporter [Cyclobacteriaceae bacterium]
MKLSEDYTALLLAALLILVAGSGMVFWFPVLSWNYFSELATIFNPQDGINLLSLFGFSFLVIWIAGRLKGDPVSLASLLGYLFIFLITLLAHIITAFGPAKELGLEIVIFSLLIGLFISNFLGVPERIKPLLQTELYIKIGLVLLGCGILFSDILKAGSLGMLQSVVVVLLVWQFCFWLGKKMKLDEEYRTMLSSAVAICGVSAAIATAGVIKGDSKKLSYVISLVLITAIPMLLFMPYLARVLDLNDATAGAWMGGTIDTTGAVVAAGNMLGEEGLKYATVVKFSQNVLLGLAAF